jgi:hypothetical protein
MTFDEAISAARAAVREEKAIQQERKLEQHLRMHGLAEVESFSGTLHFKRAFSGISPQRFDALVDRLQDERSANEHDHW